MGKGAGDGVEKICSDLGRQFFPLQPSFSIIYHQTSSMQT